VARKTRVLYGWGGLASRCTMPCGAKLNYVTHGAMTQGNIKNNNYNNYNYYYIYVEIDKVPWDLGLDLRFCSSIQNITCGHLQANHCLGSCCGYRVGQDPSDSKSNRLHVDIIFRFAALVI
jgi:hypothetical protein